MYTLDFQPTTEGRKNFEICYQAIIVTDKEVTRDNEDDFIALLSKLKKVSTEAVEKLGRIPLRDLQESGGTVMLDRSEYKLLVALVERPIWRPIILEQKRDALNWLKEIKETKLDIQPSNAE